MKIQIIGIYDRGNLSNERLHLRALADIDLTFYAILDTFYTGDASIQAGQKTCYWFASRKILAGENIVLYTRGGTESKEVKADGTYHFVFRGLASALYTKPINSSVVFEIMNWLTTSRG
ncbi:MAG TPA: hypothetical protein VGI63_09545 [Verrucomicrobiae bacterium]|jgi:hypothetical protein